MTRSMRWMSSSAPSLPFSRDCAALPQPRSRIAFAAETRAAWVASFDRMTPTRQLIAVLVWLRAIDRISVRVLGIELRGVVVRRDIFTGCRIGAIVRLFRATKRDGRKIRRPATACRTRNEADHVGIHASASHTAIATRPASASEIRYAVIRWSFLVLCKFECAA